MGNFHKYITNSAENLFLCYVLAILGLVWPLFQVVAFVYGIIYRKLSNKFLSSHYMWIYRTSIVGWTAYFILLSQMFGVVGGVVVLVALIWYIARLAFGLRCLLDKKTHANPLTFWIN